MNPSACRVWERLISRSCSEWQVSLEDTTPRQETSVLDPVRTEDGKLRLEFVCFRSALRHDFANASRPRETSASPTCESWCVTWCVSAGSSQWRVCWEREGGGEWRLQRPEGMGRKGGGRLAKTATGTPATSFPSGALVVTANAIPDPNDGLLGCGEGASVGERGAPRQVLNTRRSRRVLACCLDGPAVGAAATSASVAAATVADTAAAAAAVAAMSAAVLRPLLLLWRLLMLRRPQQ